MLPFQVPELEELECLHSAKVVVYCTNPYTSKPINDRDVPVLYECLQSIGAVDRLNLVLYAEGGSINSARRIALLLRNYSHQLTISVPYKAHSAGTLLCLAADQLILGTLASFSPLDPYIGSARDGISSPPAISSEEILATLQMAKSWFGLESDDARLEIFRILSSHIFPTTLSALYRADLQVREIGDELLSYQIQDDATLRHSIIDKMVSGYHSHDYTITRIEAQKLGLHVQFAGPEEDRILWKILQVCFQTMSALLPEASQSSATKQDPRAIIACANFRSCYIDGQWIEFDENIS